MARPRKTKAVEVKEAEAPKKVKEVKKVEAPEVETPETPEAPEVEVPEVEVPETLIEEVVNDTVKIVKDFDIYGEKVIAEADDFRRTVEAPKQVKIIKNSYEPYKRDVQERKAQVMKQASAALVKELVKAEQKTSGSIDEVNTIKNPMLANTALGGKIKVVEDSIENAGRAAVDFLRL